MKLSKVFKEQMDRITWDEAYGYLMDLFKDPERTPENGYPEDGSDASDIEYIEELLADLYSARDIPENEHQIKQYARKFVQGNPQTRGW